MVVELMSGNPPDVVFTFFAMVASPWAAILVRGGLTAVIVRRGVKILRNGLFLAAAARGPRRTKLLLYRIFVVPRFGGARKRLWADCCWISWPGRRRRQCLLQERNRTLVMNSRSPTSPPAKCAAVRRDLRAIA